jgi:adenine C2-methylase RlmN of 23S rRNA A2503 and tRNA A37
MARNASHKKYDAKSLICWIWHNKKNELQHMSKIIKKLDNQ